MGTTAELLRIVQEWHVAKKGLATTAMSGSPVVRGNPGMKAFAGRMNQLSSELMSELELTDPDMLESLAELATNARHLRMAGK